MDIDPVRLLSIAKEAGDSFLQNGQALNDSIVALAEANELNLHQISRVVEETNHYVQAALYKTSADKTFTFDVADSTKVAEKIKGRGMPKVAFFDAYAAAMPSPGAEEREVFLRKIASPRLQEHENLELDFLLKKIGQHVASFREEMLIRRVAAQEAFEHGFVKMAQDARDHVGLNGGSVSDLLKFAKLLHPDFADAYTVLFNDIRDVLEKTGTPVEKELICNDLEMPDGTVEIINGDHTLVIELDTMRNKISDDDRAAIRIRLLDTFGDAVVNGMKTLRTVQDMDRSVYDGAKEIAKKAEEGPDEFCEAIEKEAWKTKALLAVLGALGLVGAGKAVHSAVKGAVKETGRTRNEEKQLASMTHGGYSFKY